jgi:serine/threonine-protein kinase
VTAALRHGKDDATTAFDKAWTASLGRRLMPRIDIANTFGPLIIRTMSAKRSPRPEPVAARQSLVGHLVSGRYRIVRLLGEGAMGAVYLAEHTLIRKKLAFKVLHPEMTSVPEAVLRFEREAVAASHMDHPNVAAATDFGKLDDGSFFLVLEYVEGKSLRSLITAGPLGVARSLHIARQIAAALIRAHALGIVHRDLKPENVILTFRDGDADFVKVLDFGIARVPLAEMSGVADRTTLKALTQVGAVFGTPEYMAPEQARGQPTDHRTDLYALGVLLYEMLVGVTPFEADDVMALLALQIGAAPPAFSVRAPSAVIPAPVEGLVMRLLSKDPDGRFRDAKELLNALDDRRSHECVTVARESNHAGRAFRPRVPESGAVKLIEAWYGATRRLVRTGVTKAVAKLAMARRMLPARLPTGTSRSIWVAGASVCALAATIAFFVSPKSGDTDRLRSAPPQVVATHAAPPRSAPEARLAAARSTSDLERLAAEYPEDPAVWLALFHAQAERDQWSDALRSIGRLVAVDPSTANDPEVRDFVVAAAAKGPNESIDAAVALLEGHFGSKGADLLYELMTSRTVTSRVNSRAKKSLAKPEVLAIASPALASLLELRDAARCESKRDALAGVAKNGDARSLAVLRRLASTRGCGFLEAADCWPCLRGDDVLASTTATVERRVGDAGF